VIFITVPNLRFADTLRVFATPHADPSPGFSSRGGQVPEGGATFLKYSIGCMQQPVGQT